MAGNGPPPAENKRRRNKDTHAEGVVTVPADAVVEAPELPNAGLYSPQTLVWYDTWCQAPQASLFTVTDWQRLHMLAALVNDFWENPRKDLLAEIRLNESLLGATHTDRLKARVRIEQPKPEPAAPPEGVADFKAARRRRMNDAS
ncbi:hypothetical protein [Streptomyces synnematoformans]|uniref:Terminase small subunit n=1 Tax=Streptomyces synnematoformans TaxID=415721 RepID=A0ABN2XAD9_9ACTN